MRLGAREILRKAAAFFIKGKGCGVYEGRPAVCRCDLCLTEDNLRAARDGRFVTCSNCPTAVEL